jgi:hypothetical protein
LSYPDYLDYSARARSFESLAAHYPTSPMHVVVNGERASITGAAVTATYFDVLRIGPSIGRFFTAEEDLVRDRDAVVVIGDAFWERHFQRAANAVGGAMQINGHTFSVVGVAPPGFTGVRNGGPATEL